MNINHIIKWNFFCIATFSALIATGCSGSKGSIHEAAIKADLAMVKRLVKSGLDINIKGEKELTALHPVSYTHLRAHETS